MIDRERRRTTTEPPAAVAWRTPRGRAPAVPAHARRVGSMPAGGSVAAARRRRGDRPAAGRHEQADLLALGGRAVDQGDDLAPVHHRDPVGQLQDLVQLGGDEQDRCPASRLAIDLAMDELDAADVETAGGLVEDQEPSGRG